MAFTNAQRTRCLESFQKPNGFSLASLPKRPKSKPVGDAETNRVARGYCSDWDPKVHQPK